VSTIVRAGTALRAGAALLLIGPLASWVAECITAAAWQHPHYAPLYNWVSHLDLSLIVGVSLVGIFQGSDANVANGLIDFHQFDAQGVIVAGNIMAILVGAAVSRIGLTRTRGSVSTVLGTGLLSHRRAPALTTRKAA
jgi:uncharacterized membrane protein (UPF0136 family)